MWTSGSGVGILTCGSWASSVNLIIVQAYGIAVMQSFFLGEGRVWRDSTKGIVIMWQHLILYKGDYPRIEHSLRAHGSETVSRDVGMGTQVLVLANEIARSGLGSTPSSASGTDGLWQWRNARLRNESRHRRPLSTQGLQAESEVSPVNNCQQSPGAMNEGLELEEPHFRCSRRHRSLPSLVGG